MMIDDVGERNHLRKRSKTKIISYQNKKQPSKLRVEQKKKKTATTKNESERGRRGNGPQASSGSDT